MREQPADVVELIAGITYFLDSVLSQFDGAEIAKRHTKPVAKFAGAHAGHRLVDGVQQRSFGALGADSPQYFEAPQG